MTCSNCCSTTSARISSRYRKALWIAFGLNLTMFMVEIVMGVNQALFRYCLTALISSVTALTI